MFTLKLTNLRCLRNDPDYKNELPVDNFTKTHIELSLAKTQKFSYTLYKWRILMYSTEFNKIQIEINGQQKIGV